MTEKLHRDDERGITVLELLVTLLIVAILSAAATSYFLHQRRKGWMAQVVAATKNLASVQEFWINTTGAGGYATTVADLVSNGFNYADEHVVPSVIAAGRDSFCLEVASKHDESIVWHYSSSVGRPEEGPADPACVAGITVAAAPGTPENQLYVPIGSVGTSTTGEGSGGATSSGGSTTSSTGASGGDSSGGSPAGDTSVGASGGPSGRHTTTGGTSGTSSSGGSSGGTSGGDGNGIGSDHCNDGEGAGEDGSTHPSGEDRAEESGGSGTQGDAQEDPDGDSNGGTDETGGTGGSDQTDQDGNNGSGNDSDFEDDNQGPDGTGTGGGADCNTDAEPLIVPW